MKTHDLKTWPVYFDALRDGSKTFEVRRDDRGYDVGDVLNLKEWDPVREAFTGRLEVRVVSYVLDAEGAASEALRDGFVVMGFAP